MIKPRDVREKRRMRKGARALLLALLLGAPLLALGLGDEDSVQVGFNQTVSGKVLRDAYTNVANRIVDSQGNRAVKTAAGVVPLNDQLIALIESNAPAIEKSPNCLESSDPLSKLARPSAGDAAPPAPSAPTAHGNGNGPPPGNSPASGVSANAGSSSNWPQQPNGDGLGANSSQQPGARTAPSTPDSVPIVASMPQTNSALAPGPAQDSTYVSATGSNGQGFTAPAQTAGPKSLSAQIQTITASAAGDSLYTSTRAHADEIVRSASSDYNTLSNNIVERVSSANAKGFFKTANTYFRDTIKAFESAKSDLPAGNQKAFLMNLRTAEEKSAAGLSLLQDEDERMSTPTIGTLALFRNPASIPLTSAGAGPDTTPLLDLFDLKSALANPVSTDALADRNIMLAGLPNDEKSKVVKSLKLVENVKLTLPDGRVQNVPLLHNGYILGAAKTGTDCSSLVSGSLSPFVRQSRFTTLDFRQMWILLKRGRFPNPPAYDPKHEKEVRIASQAFTAIDVEHGEPLAKGDLLIYRTEFEAIGHVVMVQSYDPRFLKAVILEASQSAGTVRERDFYLEAIIGSRIMKAGFMALRLKPSDNKGCKYRDIASRGGDR